MGNIAQERTHTAATVKDRLPMNNVLPLIRGSYVPATVARTAAQVAQDCQITNIFANIDQDAVQEIAANINVMRVSRRSKASRSRLLALRRQIARCTHTQVKRPGGKQGERSLREIRAHVFCDDAPQPQQISMPLRIATHSINMALILAVLPIGAASLTYNLLRGEDMAITARLTTLAGLVLVFFGGQAGNLLGAI